MVLSSTSNLPNALSRKNWFCVSITLWYCFGIFFRPDVSNPCQNSVVRSTSGRSVDMRRATHVAITSTGFSMSKFRSATAASAALS